MVAQPNYGLSTDTTLGGNSPSDIISPSEKAIKTYVDNNSGLPSQSGNNGKFLTTNGEAASWATINIPTVDSALSTTSTNPVQNKVVTTALDGKFDSFTLRFAGNWSGGVHAVNFVTIDYSECTSEQGVFIKFSMVNSHGNGQAGRFLQDIILNVTYTGNVAGTMYRYFAVPIDQASSEYYGSHYYGDVFWVNDTTNKIVRFYVLMHQFSYTSQTPYFRLNASTKGVITQATGGAGAAEYSTGTRVWTTINNFDDIPTVVDTYSSTGTDAISGKGVKAALDTLSIPSKISDLTDDTATYPVDKADTLTGLTATITELNYVDGVTSGIQTQLNGKQATLVSGTNIKTINSTSLLGNGDISITGLPSQTSQSGKFLTTNGTTASWANAPTEIPSQTGNSGKFLTTNGSSVSWATVDALPSQTSQSGKFLTTNGTTASWADTTKVTFRDWSVA